MSTGLLPIATLVAVSIVAARYLSKRLRLPPTGLLVLFGLILGALPLVPYVELDPGFVLTVLIPPLLYQHAAERSAPREVRSDWGPIALLGVGLTLLSAGAVGLVAHLMLPQLPWAAALALGAALAPTEARALERLGAPERITTLLRGESLINEGVAVVLFAIALEQLSRPVTVPHAAVQIGLAIAGGAGVGLMIGWGVVRLRRLLADSGTLLVLSLATPFVAEVTADKLGLSGPLAVTAAGFFVGTRSLHSPARATERITWQVLAFLLGGTLAVLLGLHLRDLLTPESGLPITTVLAATAGLLAVLLAARILAALVVCPRRLRVLTLGGTRGVTTLALALAIPAVAERSALIFVAACAVLLSGFALLTSRAPAVSGREHEEERVARRVAASAAISRLDQVAHAFDPTLVWGQRQLLAIEADGHSPELRGELARAQRETLGRLYSEGTIGAPTLHRLTEEIDLRDPHATTTPGRH